MKTQRDPRGHSLRESPTSGRVGTGDGFALIGLLLFMTAGTAVLALLVGRLHVSEGGRSAITEVRARQVLAAAADHHRRYRGFPATIDALATTPILDPNGEWRFDPFGGAQRLLLRRNGRPVVLTVTSRGRDQRRGTADDVIDSIADDGPARHVTRSRLRVLRAAYLRSPYMNGALMTPAERATMRQAVGTFARAQRALLYADAAGKVAMTAQRDAAAATIAGLQSLHALPAPPPGATGVGGLLEQLSLPDALGTDAWGGTLVVDRNVGFLCIGGDRRSGGDDDF